MRKLLKYAFICLILFLAFKSYQISKENGGSFLNNFGKQTKILVDKGVELVDDNKDVVIEKAEEVKDEVVQGYNETK